jgi:hypothetical protein
MKQPNEMSFKHKEMIVGVFHLTILKDGFGYEN